MMANLSEDIQSADSDTRPPMLDRETLVDGVQGLERDIVFKHITPEEKDRCKADIRATNILLQGSELTKDEHESQLYDDFEHFRQKKEKPFTNTMSVKLNRGLKTSNYDQLYAYLKPHEAHANKNKMMLERYTQHAIDPLAFVFNVSLQQYPTQSSAIPQSAYIPLLPINHNLTSSNTRNQATVQNGRVVVQNVQGRQNRVQGNNARGAVAAGNRGVQNRVGNANPGQAKPIKHYNCNGIGHIARKCTHPKRPQNLEYFKDKMLLMQAQENVVVLDEEQLLFIVFQADQCDAFDSDVDEAPTAQTMFMANLSSADPIYDEAGPSYDSDILSEVQDYDNYLDSVGEYHEVHEMQNDVQPNYVVDSDAEYTSDSNIIPYEQYMKDNAVQVVQSNVSSVPNDALMMIINDTHEQAAQCVSANEQNKVVNESLTAELARYKE
ncbi:hypothetical protein Tco_0767398 [Tanacetum coccineum]